MTDESADNRPSISGYILLGGGTYFHVWQ